MSRWNKEERDKLPLSQFADPDSRKFPIATQEDVDAAAHLVGRSSNPDKVRKRIIEIAKRLGLSIPDAWKEDSGKSSPAIERKTMDFAVKEIGDGDGAGSFTLYAAIFGNIDRSNEKILAGAFKNLPEFVQDGFFALNHDWKSLPIGLINEATQDHIGLKVSGFFHSHPEAQAARRVMLERMSHGKSIKCSIGYIVNDDARAVENGKSFRLLKSITVYEASLVSVPANELAHVVDVKALSEGDDASGGATVPDDTPAAGDHVKWGAYAKGMAPGCGTVKSIHVKGKAGGMAASEDSPVAAVYKCMDASGMGCDDVESKAAACKCMMTKTLAYHPAGELSPKAGTPTPADDAEVGGAKAAHACTCHATKGQYLGDTDEMMVCAALDRLIAALGYYLFSTIRGDGKVAEVVANAGAAIDEFKATAVSLLDSVLIDDDPEDDDDTPDPADMVSGATAQVGYGMMSATLDKYTQKYLANLASLDTSRDGAVTALALEKSSGALASEVAELIGVHRKHFVLRAKEGRTLSGATRQRIKAVLDGVNSLVSDLEALLSETEPKAKGEAAGADPAPAAPAKALPPDAAAIRAAQAEFALFEFEQTCGGAA